MGIPGLWISLIVADVYLFFSSVYFLFIHSDWEEYAKDGYELVQKEERTQENDVIDK